MVRLTNQSCIKESKVLKPHICVPSSDFDRRVNDNKTAAEDAMRRIPEINATINEANEKTQRAEKALGNAASDAKEAKAKAEEAEKIANDVQKVRIDC